MMTRHTIWCFFTIFCLCISIIPMSLSVSEQGIVIVYPDPPSFTVNLTGGDTVTEDIIVRWTGEKPVNCNISTDITSDCPGNDSEGINVTYEPSPFNLIPNVDYTVEMIIKAAINIMPGVYTITTNFSCKAGPPPPSPPSPPGYLPSLPVNIPPVADASAGELYTGYVDEEIPFDGSNSSDIDGTITEWFWDFGDGGTGAGETTTHSYSNPGTYNVTLTVKDNIGDTGTYETVAIIKTGNRLPTTPIINGAMLGNKTVEYNYTAVSTDPDNDTIRYFFDWGDGTNTTSDFLESHLIYDTNHNWTTSGVYTITVYAEDINGGVSGTTEMTVFIDVQFIDVIQGYLLDTNDDGIYDIFHNNATGNETTVELQDNGNYLIDSDGDAIWDYEYNPETSMLDTYTQLKEDDITLWYALTALIVISVIIFAYFIHLKKKEKDKGQKKKKAKSKKEK